jgi:hypothetical protein
MLISIQFFPFTFLLPSLPSFLPSFLLQGGINYYTHCSGALIKKHKNSNNLNHHHHHQTYGILSCVLINTYLKEALHEE